MKKRKHHKKLLTFNRKNSLTKEFCKIQKKLAESEQSDSRILAVTSTSFLSVTIPCMKMMNEKGVRTPRD